MTPSHLVARNADATISRARPLDPPLPVSASFGRLRHQQASLLRGRWSELVSRRGTPNSG